MSDRECPLACNEEYNSQSMKLFNSFLGFKKMKMSRIFNKTSKQCGATLMLMYRMSMIHRDKCGIKVKDLSEAMHVSVSSMSRTIKNLEEQGLLERKEDNNDRRNTYVYLTKQGEMISEKYVQSMKKIGNRVCERMGWEKVDTLIEYLDEMFGYINEEIDREAKEVEKKLKKEAEK